MDDYPYLHADAPSKRSALLLEDWHAIEARRVRAELPLVARVADFEQTDGRDAVGDPRHDSDVRLPFATPPGVALVF